MLITKKLICGFCGEHLVFLILYEYKRFEYNGKLVLIENEKVELNETISRLENRKINIQKEIDLIKNYSGQKKTRTSQPNIIYQPVNEFSLLLWILILEKAIVYVEKLARSA